MGGGGRTVWNSEGKGVLSILEFPKARGGLDEDAAHGRVWIFSGITHYLKDNTKFNKTAKDESFIPIRSGENEG